MKNGGAVGGEWGQTEIVRGGEGKVLVEEEEGDEGDDEGRWLWGVKLKRARCLGIFQFLRPVWCILFPPQVSLSLLCVFSLSLVPPAAEEARGEGGQGAGGWI